MAKIFLLEIASRKTAGENIDKSENKSFVDRMIAGSLSNDVVERRTSAESEPFSFLICLYATLFVLLSVFTPIERSCWKICSKSQPKIAKSPLPVVVRCSKKAVLKLPITLLR